MVLRRDADHLAGHFIFGQQGRPILLVGDDHRGALLRGQGVVNIGALLVFLEILGPPQLAHVVVAGAHPGQQGVCAHPLCRSLCQSGYVHTVLVLSLIHI